jgi:hypothetical protein
MRPDSLLTRRDALFALAVGVVAIVAYAPALRLGFAADDFLILARVQDLGGLHHPVSYFQVSFYEYYRPLVFLSQALDWQLWGLHAAGFHHTNIVLHAVNAFLVFLLVRTLADRPTSTVAALIFALHPANQEAVFWVAGRFDLLSTTFMLAALWCFWRDRAWGYWLGVLGFALALFSKESAVALLLIVVAHDAIIRRRDWIATAARLAPLLAVTAVYMLLRSHAAELSPIGGVHRLGKAAMLVSALAFVLWMARRWESAAAFRGPARPRVATTLMWMAVTGGLLTIALLVPATRPGTGPTVGFVTYAWYLLSPLGLLPTPFFLDPNRLAYVVAGVLGVVASAGIALQSASWIIKRPAMMLAVVLIVAALLPVSAMPGRTHLYLSTVGVSLLAALLLRSLSSRMAATALAGVIVLASGVNLFVAARQWQQASDRTREAVALVSADPQPCATRDIVFLTAPAGIDDVPCNINNEAFLLYGGCAPRSFQTLLRVLRRDATVVATRTSENVIDLRVPNYRGNIMASRDLRNFLVQVRKDARTVTLDTPLGQLQAWPEGATQVFQLVLNAAATHNAFYYYSQGRMRLVPPR